ncbi:MAG: hypothetical protein H6581_01185 [Bacteroidia bacterium]|nr:hypothetical protein [Bacteroidia bacterium]
MKNPFKHYLTLFTFAALLVGISSCAKLESVLSKGTGEWNLAEIHIVAYWNDTLTADSSLYDQGYYKFNEDGTGAGYDNNGNMDGTFTWVADKKSLTISDDSSSYVQDMELVSGNSKRKEFFFTIEETDQGNTIKIEENVILEKRD